MYAQSPQGWLLPFRPTLLFDFANYVQSTTHYTSHKRNCKYFICCIDKLPKKVTVTKKAHLYRQVTQNGDCHQMGAKKANLYIAVYTDWAVIADTI
jgi:hypothetical protein